jgi:hypothetical protein
MRVSELASVGSVGWFSKVLNNFRSTENKNSFSLAMVSLLLSVNSFVPSTGDDTMESVLEEWGEVGERIELGELMEGVGKLEVVVVVRVEVVVVVVEVVEVAEGGVDCGEEFGEEGRGKLWEPKISFESFVSIGVLLLFESVCLCV